MSEPTALSRAEIAAMSTDEYERRQPEIHRWMKAGGQDGEPAPPLDRPDGHVFTREEIAGMELADFEHHEPRIMAQLQNGGIS